MNAALMGESVYVGMASNNIRYIITMEKYATVMDGRGGSLRNSSLWYSGLKAKTFISVTHEEALNLLRKFYRNRIPRPLIEKAEEYE